MKLSKKIVYSRSIGTLLWEGRIAFMIVARILKRIIIAVKWRTWGRLRMKMRKVQFLRYYKDAADPEIKEMCDYIKSADRFGVFNNPLKNDWDSFAPTVKRDGQKNMFYGETQGMRIYWPEKFQEKAVAGSFKGILIEQDEYSPHRYLSDEDIDCFRKFKESGKRLVCIECGAMEALFTRTIIDYLDEAYVIECDEDWKPALEATFSDYSERVRIVSKFVSDETGVDSVKIDDILPQDCNLDDALLIVKMDIEGAETKALEGMRKLLSKSKRATLFICAYHKANDERDIRNYFSEGYEISATKGYLCFYFDPMYDKPYARRWLLKIRKNI